MDERYTTKKLLALRKLTRAISEHLRGQMKDYMATLAHLFRPRIVLGDFVQSSTKEIVTGADKVFKEMHALYEAIAAVKPFTLNKELKAPVEIVSAAVETTPLEYTHVAITGNENKSITITSPLKWLVSYSGYTPKRVRELLADKNRSPEQVQEHIVHCLVMHMVVTKQPGLGKIFAALHFPIESARRDDVFSLPIPYIACSVTTVRPPDDVIVESTELSGNNAFEEVVNLDDIARLPDPFKNRLVELVKSHDIELPEPAK